MGLFDTILAALSQAADATRDAAGKAADATRGIAGAAADKAKAGGRIAKLTMDVAREREEMKKTYLEIGKLYYDTHKDAPEGFFSQLCEEIALAEKSIAAKEAELTELKAGFTGAAAPDVEVEFEEIVDAAEAEAEGCCRAAEEKAEEACCCAEEKAEEACCCAEEKAEEAACCGGSKVDEAAEKVKDFAERAVDAVADAADKVKETIQDKLHHGDE